MKKAAALALLLLADAMLVGCSLPGQAFPGGPTPWLPGGAPGSIYGAPAATASAPAAATGPGSTARYSPDPGAAKSNRGANDRSTPSGGGSVNRMSSGTMHVLYQGRTISTRDDL